MAPAICPRRGANRRRSAPRCDGRSRSCAGATRPWPLRRAWCTGKGEDLVAVGPRPRVRRGLEPDALHLMPSNCPARGRTRSLRASTPSTASSPRPDSSGWRSLVPERARHSGTAPRPGSQLQRGAHGRWCLHFEDRQRLRAHRRRRLLHPRLGCTDSSRPPTSTSSQPYIDVPVQRLLPSGACSWSPTPRPRWCTRPRHLQRRGRHRRLGLRPDARQEPRAEIVEATSPRQRRQRRQPRVLRRESRRTTCGSCSRRNDGRGRTRGPAHELAGPQGCGSGPKERGASDLLLQHVLAHVEHARAREQRAGLVGAEVVTHRRR